MVLQRKGEFKMTAQVACINNNVDAGTIVWGHGMKDIVLNFTDKTIYISSCRNEIRRCDCRRKRSWHEHLLRRQSPFEAGQSNTFRDEHAWNGL